jgi:hypothetical protein
MRLKDRIDATIAHEHDDIRAGGKHAGALEVAAKTELPISDEARRLNRARASNQTAAFAQPKSSNRRCQPQ